MWRTKKERRHWSISRASRLTTLSIHPIITLLQNIFWCDKNSSSFIGIIPISFFTAVISINYEHFEAILPLCFTWIIFSSIQFQCVRISLAVYLLNAFKRIDRRYGYLAGYIHEWWNSELYYARHIFTFFIFDKIQEWASSFFAIMLIKRLHLETWKQHIYRYKRSILQKYVRIKWWAFGCNTQIGKMNWFLFHRNSVQYFGRNTFFQIFSNFRFLTFSRWKKWQQLLP